MRKTFIFIFSAFLAFYSNFLISQNSLNLIDFIDYHVVFPKEKINSLNISKLDISVTQKKKDDIIRESPTTKTLYFNSEGQLVHLKEYIERNGFLDTTLTYWFYHSSGQIESEILLNPYGVFVKRYSFDDNDRVISFKQFQKYGVKHLEEIKSINESGFTVQESYVYQDFDNQVKKTFFNSEGKPYADLIQYFNSFGKLEKEVFRLHRTMKSSTTAFEYCNKGKLKQISQSSISGEGKNKKITFEYDDGNNLNSAKYYENDEEQKEYQLIYDERGLLLYKLIKNASNEFITVFKVKSDLI